MAQKSSSYRLMFRFWLDVDKDDEYALAEEIEEMKQERSFSRAIRQGLRLWKSLRDRDVSYLLELFPWVEDALQKGDHSGSGSSGMKALPPGTDDALKAQIDRLEYLLEQQGNTPIAPKSGNLGQLPPLAEDIEADGDLLKITTSKDDGGQSSRNFLASMNALCDLGLDLDKLGKPKPEKTASVGAIKKMAGADQPLPMPTFDDLEL